MLRGCRSRAHRLEAYRDEQSLTTPTHLLTYSHYSLTSKSIVGKES